MAKQFIYVKSKASLDGISLKLAEGGEYFHSIVFCEETKKIYNHGAEFGLGAAEYKELTDLKAAYDDTVNPDVEGSLAKLIATNAAEIAIIKGDQAGSINKAVADAVAKLMGENVDENFDTLKEIADWILAADENAEALGAETRISTLETKVGNEAVEGTADTEAKEATGLIGDVRELQTKMGSDSVSKQISDAIDALAGEETGTDSTNFVSVTVSTENGEVSGVTVSTLDIAKASVLGEATAAAGTDTAFARIKAIEDALEWVEID